MTATLRTYFAKDSEPLRRKVHGLLSPIFAILIAKGIVTQDAADLVLSGAAYAALSGAVEWARSNVMPFYRHGGRHAAPPSTVETS